MWDFLRDKPKWKFHAMQKKEAPKKEAVAAEATAGDISVHVHWRCCGCWCWWRGLFSPPNWAKECKGVAKCCSASQLLINKRTSLAMQSRAETPKLNLSSQWATLRKRMSGRGFSCAVVSPGKEGSNQRDEESGQIRRGWSEEEEEIAKRLKKKWLLGWLSLVRMRRKTKTTSRAPIETKKKRSRTRRTQTKFATRTFSEQCLRNLVLWDRLVMHVSCARDIVTWVAANMLASLFCVYYVTRRSKVSRWCSCFKLWLVFKN